MATNTLNTLIVLFSYHQMNTEKIAKVFAEVFNASIQNPLHTDPQEIQNYQIVGFGSGIYSESFHKAMLDFADKLPIAEGTKAFLFSTDGGPRGLMKDDHPMAKEQLRKNHRKIKERLITKGYEIIGEFNCAGLNKNSFLKLFGGLNKGRPNSQDLSNARKFAHDTLQKFTSGS